MRTLFIPLAAAGVALTMAATDTSAQCGPQALAEFNPVSGDVTAVPQVRKRGMKASFSEVSGSAFKMDAPKSTSRCGGPRLLLETSIAASALPKTEGATILVLNEGAADKTKATAVLEMSLAELQKATQPNGLVNIARVVTRADGEKIKEAGYFAVRIKKDEPAAPRF
jgi:hypothetical protein